MKRIAFVRIALLLFVALSTFFILLVGTNSVFAYTFTKTIETTVEPKSTAEMKVSQSQRLSWDKSGVFFPASKNFAYAYIFPAFASQVTELDKLVRDISVTSPSSDGKSLPFTSSIADGAIQIKIPYYESLTSDNPLTFILSYTTSMYILKEGGLTQVYFPGLTKDFASRTSRQKEGYDEVTSYSLNIVLPEKLGQVVSINPTPASQRALKAQTTIVFGTKQLIGNSVKIVVGNERYIKFVLSGKTTATNTNSPAFVRDLLVNYVDVVLPTQQSGTEFSNQSIAYSKIEPFPTKLTIDADGNVIARLPVSAAKEGEILIEGYAIIRKGTTASMLKDVALSQIPSSMNRYLLPENRYWQVNDQRIQDAANGITEDSGMLLPAVRKTLAYVSQKLSYADIKDEQSLRRLGAVGALQEKVGVCMEYSDLLLTLLRAKGIPARAVFGDGVGMQVNRTLAGIGHQWVGIWLPENGWVPVDPTWSDVEERQLIGQDFDHFVWYVASQSADSPSGFNCLSPDSESACKEALRIFTTPVDEIPNNEVLLSLSDLQQKVSANESADSKGITKNLQQAVGYLGGTQTGRVLLSKQGLLITFAILLYVILVLVVSLTSRLFRKKKKVVESN